MKKQVCSSCNAQIKGKVKFCPNCGSKFEEVVKEKKPITRLQLIVVLIFTIPFFILLIVAAFIAEPVSESESVNTVEPIKEEALEQAIIEPIEVVEEEPIDPEVQRQKDLDNVNEFLVWSYTKDLVKTQLNSPSTAKFPNKNQVTILFGTDIPEDGYEKLAASGDSRVKNFITRKQSTNFKGRDYWVKGYVDAQNSFGAVVRRDFLAVVTTEDGKYDWGLEALMWE